MEGVYAHTPSPQHPVWHPLTQHLLAVGSLAGQFAAPWLAGDLAYAAGLWHDLGKFNPEFQAYLWAQHEGRPHQRVPHAMWGAAFVSALFQRRGAWKALALTIAGHHAGLPAGSEIDQIIDEFLAAHPNARSDLQTWAAQLPPPPLPTLPAFPSHDPTRREMFIRMLFSALVDADRLDTERHFSPGQERLRHSLPRLGQVAPRFWPKQQALLSKASSTSVNRIRREVYEACVAAADGPPGFYRLTAPTGAGKTLSSLAFAIKHARKHDLDRIVVAIPYTSIIEQTADAYRAILGRDAVLEHHSQFIPPEDESQDLRSFSLRLATDNWDAPVVVTTTVQLFESLFSNSPSRVRKLHRLAKSVILLDEVQTLPPGLLEPTLDGLRALVEDYGASVVLSTATQPTFEAVKAFADVQVRGELVPAYPAHFEALRRVEYEWQHRPIDWGEVAEGLRTTHQWMAVVNTRKDALALLDACGKVGGLLHLSALLCGAHRRQRLAEVRRRLERQQPVRLVSTQVVEAGVDLDFPVVWRAVGPLDRIVQAAGRCNREGGLGHPGRVVIFEPATGGSPTGPYQVGLNEARLFIRRQGAQALHGPDVYRAYFATLFDQLDLDQYGIQDKRMALNYPVVAKEYRLIREDTVPVVVPFADADTRLAAWIAQPDWRAWRALQPYLVNIYRQDIPRLDAWLHPISEHLFEWTGRYDPIKGIVPVDRDPADFII